MPTTTTVDGTTLFYNDWGSGPAVVLVHGWPLSSAMWESQALALLDAGFRVISYDRRGFGRSGQPSGGYEYNTFTDDLKAVLDACRVTSFALVGFSMGGGEVARYMSRYFGKGVAKIALIGSIVPCLLKGPDNPGGVPREVFTGIQDGLRKDRASFLAAFFPSFYGMVDGQAPVSHALLDWHLSIALDAAPHATIACVAAWLEDFRPDVKACKVPTLIVHGTQDVNVPIEVSARPARALMPHAVYKEYEGAPHGLCATHAERLNADLIAFLRG